ncbi:MAG TPA: D-alanyl-D-alanine carboxypeptidase family protein [Dehalococcoidia bacterium]
MRLARLLAPSLVVCFLIAACSHTSSPPALPITTTAAPGVVAPAPAPTEPISSNDAVSPAFPPPAPWAAAPVARGAVAAPVVNALAAVVIDEASGAVLYDKAAHEPLPPASLTKIATAILALESGGLDTPVTVDVDSASMRGSTIMGLEPGDRFSLRDLLYGLMLPSGNDAALAIARYVAGSDTAFVAQMNLLLVRLGLHDSHFENPHGLGGRNHVASAYDLAMLARYAMTLPGFFDIINARSYVAHGSRTIALTNVNSFLGAYAGADGVKTGYTRGAGQTLVASAYRKGHRVYAVVLNSPTRNDDAVRMLNWAFTNFSWP